MASSSRSEAVARLGELVLIDGSQYLVYGLLVLSVQTYNAICLIPLVYRESQVYRVSLKKRIVFHKKGIKKESQDFRLRTLF